MPPLSPPRRFRSPTAPLERLLICLDMVPFDCLRPVPRPRSRPHVRCCRAAPAPPAGAGRPAARRAGPGRAAGRGRGRVHRAAGPDLHPPVVHPGAHHRPDPRRAAGRDRAGLAAGGRRAAAVRGGRGGRGALVRGSHQRLRERLVRLHHRLLRRRGALRLPGRAGRGPVRAALGAGHAGRRGRHLRVRPDLAGHRPAPGASATIADGLTPFLAGDAIKAALAAGLLPAAWWLAGRRDDRVSGPGAAG